MKEHIEKKLIEFCEKLPQEFSIFEKNNRCKKPSNYCNYCKSSKEDYLCDKKRYIRSRLAI